jgi:hypothetical protein
MRLGAPTFPLLPADLDRLTADERAWCEHFRPLYQRAALVTSPRLALKHPLAHELAHDRSQWAMLVRFYPTHPLIFEMLLEHVTGGTVRGQSASERQAAWRAKLASSWHAVSRTGLSAP